MHVVILGAPGSGKGTQSEKIKEKFGLEHLSTGDMLRAEISNQTELGLAAKSVIDAGDLVSDDIILGMVSNKISENTTGILFDGFPRTLNQAKSLDDLLAKSNSNISHVVLLNVDNQEIIDRMLQRGRKDDNEETIKNRLDVFNNQTAPLIDFYKAQNKLHTIGGKGDIDAIFAQIDKVLSA